LSHPLVIRYPTVYHNETYFVVLDLLRQPLASKSDRRPVGTLHSASAIEKGKWLEWRDTPERTDSSGSNGPVEPDLDLDKEESFIVGRLVSADVIEHETDHAPDYGAYGVMSGRLALS
jgi:hypothetical protein